jgi:hypothetical protein
MYGNFVAGSLFGTGSEHPYHQEQHEEITQPEYFDIEIDNDSQINCKENCNLERTNSFSLEPKVDINKL